MSGQPMMAANMAITYWTSMTLSLKTIEMLEVLLEVMFGVAFEGSLDD